MKIQDLSQRAENLSGARVTPTELDVPSTVLFRYSLLRHLTVQSVSR